MTSRIPSPPKIVSRRTSSRKDNDDSDDGNDNNKLYGGQKEVVINAQREFDHRFGQPTPSPFKRAALIAFVVIMFWFAYSMRKSIYHAKQQQQIIYAKRYSNEFKYRPAASPIITERLKDGRVLVRGAQPAL